MDEIPLGDEQEYTPRCDKCDANLYEVGVFMEQAVWEITPYRFEKGPDGEMIALLEGDDVETSGKVSHLEPAIHCGKCGDGLGWDEAGEMYDIVMDAECAN